MDSGRTCLEMLGQSQSPWWQTLTGWGSRQHGAEDVLQGGMTPAATAVARQSGLRHDQDRI